MTATSTSCRHPHDAGRRRPGEDTDQASPGPELFARRHAPRRTRSIADHNGDACGSDQCSCAGRAVRGQRGRHATAAADQGQGRTRRPALVRGRQPDPVRRPTATCPTRTPPELYSIAPDGSCLTWLTNGVPASGTRPGGRRAATASPPTATPRPARSAYTPPKPTRHRGNLWLGTKYKGALLTDVARGVARV